MCAGTDVGVCVIVLENKCGCASVCVFACVCVCGLRAMCEDKQKCLVLCVRVMYAWCNGSR